eukprot:8931810-Alexandrium_andersonii.AAC.1
MECTDVFVPAGLGVFCHSPALATRHAHSLLTPAPSIAYRLCNCTCPTHERLCSCAPQLRSRCALNCTK